MAFTTCQRISSTLSRRFILSFLYKQEILCQHTQYKPFSQNGISPAHPKNTQKALNNHAKITIFPSKNIPKTLIIFMNPQPINNMRRLLPRGGRRKNQENTLAIHLAVRPSIHHLAMVPSPRQIHTNRHFPLPSIYSAVISNLEPAVKLLLHMVRVFRSRRKRLLGSRLLVVEATTNP